MYSQAKYIPFYFTLASLLLDALAQTIEMLE